MKILRTISQLQFGVSMSKLSNSRLWLLLGCWPAEESFQSIQLHKSCLETRHVKFVYRRVNWNSVIWSPHPAATTYKLNGWWNLGFDQLGEPMLGLGAVAFREGSQVRNNVVVSYKIFSVLCWNIFVQPGTLLHSITRCLAVILSILRSKLILLRQPQH